MSDITIIPPPGELANLSPLDRNPAAVYLTVLRPTGRRSMRQALDSMARMLSPGGLADCLAFDWKSAKYQHGALIRAKLQENYKAATVNKYLSALRGVMHEAFRLELIGAEQYQRIADIKGVAGETVLPGRYVSMGEVMAMLFQCEQDTHPAAGARDAAIIALMRGVGLRREEVVDLSLASYDQASGTLVIKGKRNKERTGYLVNGAALAMADWLNIRTTAGGDPLFCGIRQNGILDTDAALTPQAVYYILAERAKEAGVQPFSPHDMRRSFVSDLLDAGADISTVAKMAGHASVTTTQRYDRRPEAAKQKAANLLHIPYRGRM